MKLTGSYQINLKKQNVWDALNDSAVLKKAIPGCEEFKKNSDTEFTVTATNKIGPFNATFTGDIELKELNPPNSYKITGSGNSPVGFASGEAIVNLEDCESGTKLIYNVEANVGGKIAQVGSRLIDMTAKKMADIFFGKFSKLIEPQITIARLNDKIEEHTLPEKNASISSNKKLIYLVIVISMAISGYYFLA
jgi:carbon monoxide dehydrogenase subunit G